MTYEKGDQVHVKHPSGAEWDGVVCGIITSHTDMKVEIKLESGESVPFEWITLILPFYIEPQVGDIGAFFDNKHEDSYSKLTQILQNGELQKYCDDYGYKWKYFRPLARKLKTWEELSYEDKNTIDDAICGDVRIADLTVGEAYAKILPIALPGYPEITHARIGEDKS